MQCQRIVRRASLHHQRRGKTEAWPWRVESEARDAATLFRLSQSFRAGRSTAGGDGRDEGFSLASAKPASLSHASVRRRRRTFSQPGPVIQPPLACSQPPGRLAKWCRGFLRVRVATSLPRLRAPASCKSDSLVSSQAVESPFSELRHDGITPATNIS